ncbi:UNVERIFIED_CONTAM: hypothetical protein RMT77_009409 [Armadillidium vulgare]
MGGSGSSGFVLRVIINLFVVVLFVRQGGTTVDYKSKICIGINGSMTVPSNRDQHYRNLRDWYINCTHVDGNLELTWLQDENLDLSFLSNIQEVTGYVLISHVDVKRVVLSRLQIIRGRTLFKLSVAEEDIALLVRLSKMDTLELPALRDILQGSVSIFNNCNLCHVRSINWTEIMSDPSAKYFYTYNFTQPQRTCQCHESCEGGCWGEGSENCQHFSKITCSPQCHGSRCYGKGPQDCCHLFCAGGCTGPTQRDCLACHNFNDDGECKQECPHLKKYNTISSSWLTNPNGKYAYGATCVRDCPSHLLKDSGACVQSCPLEKKDVNGECVPCVGPCSKTCQGVEIVHNGNIDSFKDCTILEGSLTILDHSFDGFQVVYQNFTFGDKYPEMHPSKLEVFSTLEEVTGYINIQATHPEFTNLSFLRNLQAIGGRETTEYFSSLYIAKTSLKSLGLRSLRRISSGSVYILENSNLCFAENIRWLKLFKGDELKFQLLQSNKNEEFCRTDGFVCHEECSEDGCWDIGDDQCLSCRNFKLGDRCVNNCSMLGMYEKESKVCAYCHKECEGGCYGSDSSHCVRCKNVKDGPYCVATCPCSKYNNNGECENCHANCIEGCKGPENNVGEHGCNFCKKAIVNDKNDVEYCLQENEQCPYGYFSELVVSKSSDLLKSMVGNTVCRKCHPRCKNCTAYGVNISVCLECVDEKSIIRGELTDIFCFSRRMTVLARLHCEGNRFMTC